MDARSRSRQRLGLLCLPDSEKERISLCDQPPERFFEAVDRRRTDRAPYRGLTLMPSGAFFSERNFGRDCHLILAQSFARLASWPGEYVRIAGSPALR